jgi:acyl dehydratase
MVHIGGARMSFEVGQELAPEIFNVNRALLVGYANASGDQNPIHQNEDFAKSVGLENVIAHGMFTMALAGRYVSNIAGGSEKVLELSSKFIKPVVVPSGVDVQLIISAKVSAVEAGLVRLDITAMCGEVKVLGMAKAAFATL